MLRRTIPVVLALATLVGCQAAPASFARVPAATTAAAMAMAARSADALPAFGSPEDLAAAEAAETSDAWTPTEELSPFNDPASALGQGAKPEPKLPVRFAQVDESLYRGGLPSQADLKELKAKGVKTDIDLMGEIPVFDTFHVAREKRWAKQLGLKFVNVVVPTGKVPFKKKISDAVATAFLRTALDPANQPAYVHCVHGRDRTGTMVAVYRIVKHKYSNEQAFAEMKGFGFNEKDYPTLAAFVKAYKPAQ